MKKQIRWISLLLVLALLFTSVAAGEQAPVSGTDIGGNTTTWVDYEISETQGDGTGTDATATEFSPVAPVPIQHQNASIAPSLDPLQTTINLVTQDSAALSGELAAQLGINGAELDLNKDGAPDVRIDTTQNTISRLDGAAALTASSYTLTFKYDPNNRIYFSTVVLNIRPGLYRVTCGTDLVASDAYAAPGTDVSVSLAGNPVPDSGNYFILTVDGVAVDGWTFTMPDKAVTLALQQAALKDASLDLTGTSPVAMTIDEYAILTDFLQDESLKTDQAPYDFCLDLDKNSTPDVGIDGDSKTAVRLAGADLLEKASYTLQANYQTDPAFPYKSLTLVVNVECTVTFSPGEGGSGTMNPVTVSKGQAYKLPACAFTAPADKEFDQWNLGAPGTEITVSGNITVTAVWKNVSQSGSESETSAVEYCTVTFSPGKGSGTMDPVTVIKGAAYKLPACTFTAPANQEFKAWDLGAAGAEITILADTKVTALWQDAVTDPEPEPEPDPEITYLTVTFMPNSGSGTMLGLRVAAGDSVRLTDNQYYRHNYSFTGWNTQADGKGTAYANRALVTPEEDLTLYAQWDPIIKLTIKVPKVSKSAKKCRIKATLKIGGKPVKGKTITLKFRGKKYKAKTDKKGVAYFTIKKNVLQKLKVGKKIKITATYIKVTVKKQVKVKK